MMIFVVTFFFIALVIVAMAVGAIMGRKPIQGSCGGMSALGMETACDICGGDQTICDEENDRVSNSATDLGYDASVKKN